MQDFSKPLAQSKANMEFGKKLNAMLKNRLKIIIVFSKIKQYASVQEGKLRLFNLSDDVKQKYLDGKEEKQEKQLRSELEELEPLFFHKFNIDLIDYEIL